MVLTAMRPKAAKHRAMSTKPADPGCGGVLCAVVGVEPSPLTGCCKDGGGGGGEGGLS